MKRAMVFVLTLLFASAAIAQLTSGIIVSSGAPFPIVADFNGDGLDDLIQERNVILNNGMSLAEVRDLGLGDEKVIGVLDANGDHLLDLLTEGSTVRVPANLPQPPIQGPGYRLYLADASHHYSTAIAISSGARPYIADVDGDGKDDFVLFAEVRKNGYPVGTDVTVLRSRGDGTFDALEPFRIIGDSPQIMPSHRVLSADLNHDGKPDLVIRCVQDLVVLLGTGGGRFSVKNRHLPQNENFGTQSARLGDVDGDGNPDVILPAYRGIRVFFGDGRGNFTRTAQASIARTHEIELPPDLAFLNTRNINEPRDLALGHFTRSDRMQIAAGTLEGDLVVFSYERGGLQEVSRTRTEFWHIDVRSGHFRGSGTGDDVYVTGTFIWGEMYPRPRLFNGFDTPPALVNSDPLASRRRATGPVASDSSSLQMQMQGDCIDEAAGQWRFSREGVFGLAKRGDTTIEAVFDGPQIYFRLSAPYATEPAYVVLNEENGSYSGTANVMTTCGRKVMTVSAKAE